MDLQNMAARSPIRVLEKMISGGLEPGELGVIMARAGVGKTAFLIQIGLDAMLRGEQVLHIAVGQNTDYVQAWYDALFDELARFSGAAPDATARSALAACRVIKTYAEGRLTPEQIEQTIDLFLKHIGFSPQVILLDGYNWEGPSAIATAAALGAFKSCSRRLKARLWMSAQTHRSITSHSPRAMTPPCDACAELIDAALYLEPEGREVNVIILKDHDTTEVTDTPLLINCDTFSLAAGSGNQSVQMPHSAYTLLSGGVKGAEAFFGECAERWGLSELNFTFEGHQPARTRGLIRLTPEELEQGHVSNTYIRTQMNRTYPDTPLFRKVLQSIWHQVNTAREIFVVGAVQDDGTVRGGTGWAAELGRHWNKPVYVFDQTKHTWLTWKEQSWREVNEPVISSTRFAGTGTRFLTDEGKEAILQLFVRSFGKKA